MEHLWTVLIDSFAVDKSCTLNTLQNSSSFSCFSDFFLDRSKRKNQHDEKHFHTRPVPVLCRILCRHYIELIRPTPNPTHIITLYHHYRAYKVTEIGTTLVLPTRKLRKVLWAPQTTRAPFAIKDSKII